MEDGKKIAAAIAAVDRYMEMEASDHDRQSFRKGMPWDRYVNAPLNFRFNIWGASGRRDQMQVRILMQLRTFNKSGVSPKAWVIPKGYKTTNP